MQDIFMLTPKMLLLLGALTEYCYVNNLPVTITSIIEDVDGRQSQTHKEGRAVDISVRGWEPEHITKLLTYLNSKYRLIAAISKSDGEPRAAIYHEGIGWHLHLQVRP